MSRILHIETSAEACSIAVSENGLPSAQQTTLIERSHAGSLHVFINEVMKSLDFDLNDLDAIAVSKGPGSYTGLRIGVSSAKGLCYALEKPLISVGTLDALADFTGKVCSEHLFNFGNDLISSQISQIQSALKNIKDSRNLLLCPMTDARRHEVYAAIYDRSGQNKIREIKADIVDENTYSEYLKSNPILFFGSGAMKCVQLINHSNAYFAEQIYPLSLHMLPIAQQKYKENIFEDVAYFEPFYLKDFAGSIPRRKAF